jgi:CDP-glycerol glycerophosphotransferase
MFFYFFPIKKNRFLFIANEGRGYTCNLKYIFEHIYALYKDKYEFIWCMNISENLPKKYSEIETVKFLSYKYIKYELTSKYVITNFTVDPFIKKRKHQIFVNTWHGVPYKNIEIDGSLYMKTLRDIRSKTTDYVISECELFTKVMSKEWLIGESKFMPIRLPRNDLFFKDMTKTTQKVRNIYNVIDNIKIILYAPTFRGNIRRPDALNIDLDVKNLLKILSLKYNNEFVLFSRSHHNIFDSELHIENAISVNNYPDMQELLSAADVLITDYSSSMWDFSLTYKPCFVYAPDLKRYGSVRGFQIPIEQWPFPIAETNERLMQNIKNFDEEKYKQAIKQHHLNLGSYETGTAAEQFCKRLLRQ